MNFQIKFVTIVTIILLSFSQLFSQVTEDPIEVKANPNLTFLQSGQTLKINQVIEIMKPDEEAYKAIKLAKRNMVVKNILQFSGGLLVGYSVGTFIVNSELNWVVVWSGIGVTIASAPFVILYHYRAKNAVKIFNRGLLEDTASNTKLSFGINPNGIGLRLTF